MDNHKTVSNAIISISNDRYIYYFNNPTYSIIDPTTTNFENCTFVIRKDRQANNPIIVYKDRNIYAEEGKTINLCANNLINCKVIVK